LQKLNSTRVGGTPPGAGGTPPRLLELAQGPVELPEELVALPRVLVAHTPGLVELPQAGPTVGAMVRSHHVFLIRNQ